MRPLTTALMLLLVSGGCGAEDAPLQTVSLQVKFRLLSTDGLTTRAVTEIRDRFGDLVLLDATDEVQVSLPEWQIELIPQQGTEPWYEASVPAVADGAEHIYSILRQDRKSAVSRVVMPAAPELTAPATWARSTEELTVSWTGQPGPALKLLVEGSCIDPVVVDAPDADGVYTFAAGELAGQGSCSLLITARRRTVGELDDDLRIGSISARQERSVIVDSTN